MILILASAKHFRSSLSCYCWSVSYSARSRPVRKASRIPEMEDDITNSRRSPRDPQVNVSSRPPSQDSLLSSSMTVSSATDRDLLLQRKSPLPRKLRRSIEDTPYIDVEFQKSSRKGLAANIHELQVAQLLPPKPFRQTQRFLGIKLGRWRLTVRHASIFSILFVVIFVPVYYATLAPSSFDNNAFYPFAYDCSASPGWLGIDIRFGRFSYGEAKAIDLAWNWVVGRGVQGILSLIAYRVFSDALLRAAEMTHLSFELFASLSLYSNRLDMAWQLIKGLGKRGNWRTRSIFMFLLLSTGYLLAFPS